MRSESFGTIASGVPAGTAQPSTREALSVKPCS